MPKLLQVNSTKRTYLAKKLITQTRNTNLSFGHFGILCSTAHYLTLEQLEAARRYLMRVMNRKGHVWIKISHLNPVTQKAIGVRMGKGKGQIETHVVHTAAGQVFLEFSCSANLDTNAWVASLNVLLGGNIRIIART